MDPRAYGGVWVVGSTWVPRLGPGGGGLLDWLRCALFGNARSVRPSVSLCVCSMCVCVCDVCAHQISRVSVGVCMCVCPCAPVSVCSARRSVEHLNSARARTEIVFSGAEVLR